MASDAIVASVLEKSTLGCAVETLFVEKRKGWWITDRTASGVMYSFLNSL